MSNKRFLATVLGVGAVLAVVVVLAVVIFTGGDDPSATTAQPVASSGQTAQGGQAQARNGIPPFTLKYDTTTWKRVDPSTISAKNVAVALQRQNKSGLVTMRIQGPVNQGLQSLADGTVAKLKTSVDGFRLIDSGTTQLASGSKAGLLSWTGKDGRVHSTLVVPAGKHSFILDAVIPAGQKKSADEVAAMFSGFATR